MCIMIICIIFTRVSLKLILCNVANNKCIGLFWAPPNPGIHWEPLFRFGLEVLTQYWPNEDCAYRMVGSKITNLRSVLSWNYMFYCLHCECTAIVHKLPLSGFYSGNCNVRFNQDRNHFSLKFGLGLILVFHGYCRPLGHVL